MSSSNARNIPTPTGTPSQFSPVDFLLGSVELPGSVRTLVSLAFIAIGVAGVYGLGRDVRIAGRE